MAAFEKTIKYSFPLLLYWFEMDDSKNAYSQVMKVKPFDIEARRLICIMNHVDAVELGLFPLDRAELHVIGSKRRVVTVVDVTKTMVKPNQLGVFKDVKEKLLLKKGSRVKVTPVPKPPALSYIKKKLDGQELNSHEIGKIVEGIGENSLSEIEESAFVSAVYIHGYTLDETVAMAKALAGHGKQLRIGKRPVVDKHCIGGINGRSTLFLCRALAKYLSSWLRAAFQ